MATVNHQCNSIHPKMCVAFCSQVEEENSLDLAEYRLQYCYGYIKKNDGDNVQTFQDAYQGPNTLFTMRHLRPEATYTFRVCGRTEGAEMWSPWSIPCSGATKLPHYGESF